MELNCTAQKNGDTREVTLTSDDELFKDDIDKNDIVIYSSEYVYKSDEIENLVNIANSTESVSDSSAIESVANSSSDSVDEAVEEAIEDGAFSESKLISDFTVTKKDDNTVVLTFTDNCQYGSYDFYIHKDGTEDGKYALGSYTNLPDITAKEPDAVPDAVATMPIYDEDENPVIDISLINVTANEIKPENITLSGAFCDLTVSDVKVSDNNIIINTTGTVNVGSAPYGYVEIDGDAVSTGEKLTVTAEIETPDIFIDAETYSCENSTLTFNAELFGATVEKSAEELVKLIKLDGKDIISAVPSDDKTIITITVPAVAGDIDTAIASIEGKELTISKDALSCDTDIDCDITSTQAFIFGYMDKVEKSDDGYKATFELFPIFGELKDLTKDDISFDGDFANATVNELKIDEDGYGYYTCTITFKSDKSLESDIFSGNVTVSDGKLINNWKTVSPNTKTELDYITDTSEEMSRADDEEDEKDDNPYNIISAFTKNKGAYKSLYSMAKCFIDAGTNIASFNFSGFITATKGFLTECGIIKSKPDKFDKVYSAIKKVEKSIKNLDEKLSKFEKTTEYHFNEMEKDIEDLRNLINAGDYNTALGNWQAFYKNNMVPLKNELQSTLNDTKKNLVKFVKTAKSGDTVSIVFDNNGELTIADKLNDKISVENILIDKTKTKTLTLTEDCFTNAFDKLNSNCDTLLRAVQDDLKVLIKEQKLADNDNDIETLSQQFGTSILTQAMYDALTENSSTINNILNDFDEFCEQLIGDGRDTPLKQKFYTIYANYNFQTEAKDDLIDFNNYLKAFTVRYGSFAMIAATYSDGYDKEKNPVGESIEKCLTFLENNTGLKEVPEGYNWCYTVDKPVKMVSFKVVGSNSKAIYKVNSNSVVSGILSALNKLAGSDKSKMDCTVRFEEWAVYNQHKPYTTSGNQYWFNCTKLSPSQLKAIKFRYLTMGYDKKDFYKYMTDEKLGGSSKLANTNYYVYTSFGETKSFAADNTKSLWTTDNYGWNDVVFEDYQLGKKYSIGENEKKGIEKKNFSYCKETTGTLFDLNTCETKINTPIIQNAYYGKSRPMWTQDHWMKFQNNCYDTNHDPILITYELG